MAHRASTAMGSAWAFAIAVFVCLVWAVSGPFFHYSETWQLIINTGTTVATFLMIFLVQNSQNRDSKAMLLKLDELIRAQTGARNGLISLEAMSEAEIQRLEAEFQRLRAAAPARPKPKLVPELDARGTSTGPAAGRRTSREKPPSDRA
jgi:low affinity Fe/Cu permease